MEQQNASSHPLLPPGFANPSFAPTFSGITPSPSNVGNPLLASTLHHLQELSAAQGAAGLLPNSSQLTLSSQFAAELNNIAAVGWPAAQNANASWLEQAKVAAILPMYTVFSAGSLKPNETGTFDAAGEIVFPTNNNVPISSPVISVSSGIYSSETKDNLPKVVSQPSTPQQRRQQQHTVIGSTHSSPANAMFGIDRQADSSQSHCSADLRPCSTSSMGPSSVPNYTSTGSVDQLPPGSVGSVSIPTSSNTVRPCSQQNSSSFAPLRVTDPCGPHSPTQVSAASVTMRASAVHSRPFYTTSSNQGTEVRAVSSILQSATSNGTSSEVNQSSSTTNQQVSSTPHENSVENNSLEDLPWSSIDLADIDLFGGSSVGEKDVMHSVLDEMDPTVMHRLFMNEPSTSAAGLAPDASKITKLPANTSQLVTPKIREKIKMRREKELADADKELDRLLSLVAKKDATSAPAPKIPKLLPSFDQVMLTKSGAPDDHKISLSPVQFTPPDSPTSSTSPDNHLAACNFFFPSSTSSTNTTRPSLSHITTSPANTRLLFMSSTEKKNKSNKVPVYKQKTKSFIQTVLKTEEHAPDDEYSFTDDEEESKPLPFGATISETQLREHRLEAEVAQKLARISSAHPELKAKVGINEPRVQQDLWRHVVPKKRHSAALERPSVPSTPLLPPASVSEHRSESVTSQKLAEPQTIADLLLRRKQHRSSFGFLKTKCLGDQETAKSEQQMEPSVITIKGEPGNNSVPENGAQPEQPLPKLLIRLPRRLVDEIAADYEKPKKKKKRKRKDRDREWVGSEPRRKKKRKKRKHKHRHKNKRKDVLESETKLTNKQEDQWSTSEGTSKEAIVFSKKRRLIMHWNELEENVADSEYYRDQSNYRNTFGPFEDNDGHSVHPDSSDHSVLSKFYPVNGHLAKGTFVVCKADILKEECPLWRVDNQNLLQKYPPFTYNGRIAYRNSSTYSGWCDQIADSYIGVRVRFIKHSRSESIIEPEMSLLDMFPAVSTEYEEQPLVNLGTVSDRRDLFAGDPVRKQMTVYVKAMLNHAIDMTFLQAAKQKSDWIYLCALNDIDKLNQERKAKVQSQVKWIQRYLDLLHFYSSCVICDSEDSGLSCQACGGPGVEKIVQLFCNEGYDYDTLEAEEVCYTGSGSPLHAVEYLVCSSCAKQSKVYHKMHHMRYMLLKRCEDKLEKVSAGHVDLSSEAAVEACLNDAKWLRAVVNEYADLWRKIEMNGC